MSENPQIPVNGRVAGGLWAKGYSPNPKGRPKTGFQSFKDRLLYWVEEKTLKELKSLVDDPDEKRLDKLLAIDAMVVQRVRAACRKDGNQDFIAVLDRLLGKPMQAVEATVTHALAARLDEAEKLLTDDSAPMIEGQAMLLQTSILSLEPEDKLPVNTKSDSFEDLV